jgi:hypothetical protein
MLLKGIVLLLYLISRILSLYSFCGYHTVMYYVPGSTEDKVDSAVVSPLIKSLPDDGPYAAETCRILKNM